MLVAQPFLLEGRVELEGRLRLNENPVIKAELEMGLGTLFPTLANTREISSKIPLKSKKDEGKGSMKHIKGVEGGTRVDMSTTAVPNRTESGRNKEDRREAIRRGLGVREEKGPKIRVGKPK